MEVTKNMGDGFIIISGYLNVIAGIVLLVYWYAFALFLPCRELSITLSILVKNCNWSSASLWFYRNTGLNPGSGI